MIIGNNNPNNNTNKFINSTFNNTNNNKPDLLTKDLNAYKYTDPANKKDMYDKSLAILQQRYENNLISLDEFRKKCETIRKNRDKF